MFNPQPQTQATVGANAPSGTLRPGTVSPLRPVPAGIARPEYVGKKRVAPPPESDVQTPEVIAAMRQAGRLAAQALQYVGAQIKPGVTTDSLDRLGHEFIIDQGAYPSPLQYPARGARPFPKSLCTSINEVVCHGIPDSTKLAEGDIVNIDITVYLMVDGLGVHGDTDATFAVGTVDPQSAALIEHTEQAMYRGIKAVAPGREVNVIGRVIESYAKRHGYGVVREFTGHGIGQAFHSGLVIPHYDAPEYNTVIEPGMTFTIEPMLTLGGAAWESWDDGWTIVTQDRSRTAQSEHTIVVTDTGAEILTTT